MTHETVTKPRHLHFPMAADAKYKARVASRQFRRPFSCCSAVGARQDADAAPSPPVGRFINPFKIRSPAVSDASATRSPSRSQSSARKRRNEPTSGWRAQRLQTARNEAHCKRSAADLTPRIKIILFARSPSFYNDLYGLMGRSGKYRNVEDGAIVTVDLQWRRRPRPLLRGPWNTTKGKKIHTPPIKF